MFGYLKYTNKVHKMQEILKYLRTYKLNFCYFTCGVMSKKILNNSNL